MNVVLFGGSGLVGNSLTDLFSNNFPSFTVVSRNINTPSINCVSYDAVASFKTIKDKLPKTADTIIINAGSITEPKSDNETRINLRINYEYVLDILDYALCCSAKKIIYTSTLAFLKKPLASLITEEHSIEPTNQYASSKFKAEEAIKEFCETNKIRWYSFRITSPVNTKYPELNRNLIQFWLNKGMNHQNICIFGNGERMQNFIDTEKIAEIYLKSAKGNYPSGIYQLASEDSISMNDLAKLFAKKFGIQTEHDLSKLEDHSYIKVSNTKIKESFNHHSFLSSAGTIKKLFSHIS